MHGDNFIANLTLVSGEFVINANEKGAHCMSYIADIWPDIKFSILIRSMAPPQGGGGHFSQMPHPGSVIDSNDS